MNYKKITKVVGFPVATALSSLAFASGASIETWHRRGAQRNLTATMLGCVLALVTTLVVPTPALANSIHPYEDVPGRYKATSDAVGGDGTCYLKNSQDDDIHTVVCYLKDTKNGSDVYLNWEHTSGESGILENKLGSGKITKFERTFSGENERFTFQVRVDKFGDSWGERHTLDSLATLKSAGVNPNEIPTTPPQPHCEGSGCNGESWKGTCGGQRILESSLHDVENNPVEFHITYSDKCDAAYFAYHYHHGAPMYWYLVGGDCTNSNIVGDSTDIVGTDACAEGATEALPSGDGFANNKWSDHLGGFNYYKVCYSLDSETIDKCSKSVKAEIPPEPEPEPFTQAENCQEAYDRWDEVDTQNPPTVYNCEMLVFDFGGFEYEIVLNRDATNKVAKSKGFFDPTTFQSSGLELLPGDAAASTGTLLDFYSAIKAIQSDDLAKGASSAYLRGGCVLAHYKKSYLVDTYYVPSGTMNCVGGYAPDPSKPDDPYAPA